MIVDAHGHLGRLGARDCSLAQIRQYLDTCGLDHLLVSNLDAASATAGGSDLDEAPANLTCLQTCRTEGRLVPLYWVRLGQFDASLRAFAGALAVEPFAGAFFAPLLNGFDGDDPRLDAYLSVLAKLRKPAVCCTGRDAPARPERIYNLARRHPSVAVVLCGAGGEIHWHEAVDLVARARQREDARLYLCTGRAAAEDVHAAVSSLGADRLLYGSDAICFGREHAGRCRAFLEHLREALGPEESARIVADNALELFRLR